MRRRSPSYSPPRRGYGGRGRSPPRGRYGAHRDAPCGLLVRNISKGSRPEDLRMPFERFGRVRDVYLPRDYYSGGASFDFTAREPRGFGFVQYLDPFDAAEARRHMDRQILNGREITVVFAEENRKRPEEMKMKERGGRGRMSYGGGRRSPYRGYSPAHSPRYRSPSPRDGRYSRSYEGASRRDRYESISPPPRGRGRMSRSPDVYRKDRDLTPEEELDASPVKDGHMNSDGHRKRGRHSASAEKSYSPRSREPSPAVKQSKFRSPPRESRSRSRSLSPRSPPPRRQRHASSSMSPRSRSPPPRRQRRPPSNSRDMPDPAQKTYSSLTPEERSPRGGSLSPGPSS